MKNKKVMEAFEKLDRGEISFEEVNKVLEAEGMPYRIDPWKNNVGRNEDGVGLMDTGTGTMDKVKVEEVDGVARLVTPAFDPSANWGGNPPVVMVKYCEVWHTVDKDGVTLIPNEEKKTPKKIK